MNLTTRQITSLHVGDEQIRSLYQTAFPEEEQIPWEDLMRLVDTMSLDFTAYYEGDGLVGFTIVYLRQTFNWFWYFAVKEHLRGKGIGQQILTMLIEKYKDSTNILDMESPNSVCENSAQRRRRHEFYLRNGFRDTGVSRTFGHTDMIIMMNGPGTFTMHDYDEVLRELNTYWKSMPPIDS